MAKTFDYNPDGSYHIIEDDPQNPGSLLIHHNQDVKPAVDWATKQRNSGQNDKGGLRDKDDLKHYATIPVGAILSMRKKGIDVWNPAHTKAMIREIEENYPLCKVTNRKMR
jgi:hypothetical protein